MTKPRRKVSDEKRLAEMLEVIFDYAKGDLTARGTLLDDDSAIDGVMAGINILGEELQAHVAENKRVNDSLREALDYAQTLIKSAPDAILAVDRELRITACNPLMHQLCGDLGDGYMGRPLAEIGFMKQTGIAERIAAGFGRKRIAPREFTYRRPGAKEDSIFESEVAPIRDSSGRILGALLRMRDITEAKRAEDQLRGASLYARSLIEASLDPLVTVSLEGKITDVNQATVTASGLSREQLIGAGYQSFFADADKINAAFREVREKGVLRNCPLTIRHVSGKGTDVLCNATVLRDESGKVTGILGVARDITERKRAEKAEEEARRDGLTNLSNHRTFYQLLEEETQRTKRYNRPLSMLMLDIDHFKRVNDTYGHQAGDMILKGLSRVLEKNARVVDHVCRYGGEEFAIILPETDSAAARRIAERLRVAVERHPIDIGEGRTLGITISIGVSICPGQADTPEALVKAADDALYAAKHAGRNKVSYLGSRKPRRRSSRKAATGT